jgi:hypothetical protein
MQAGCKRIAKNDLRMQSVVNDIRYLYFSYSLLSTIFLDKIALSNASKAFANVLLFRSPIH